jgi:hypothetical protein
MSRPAPKLTRSKAKAAGALPPAAAAVPAPAMARVMAIQSCLIAGVRRETREMFEVPADRVNDLVRFGLVLSHPLAWMMGEQMQAAWREAATQMRPGLDDGTLVVDDATVAQLWAGPGRLLSPPEVPEQYTAAEPTEGALRVLQVTEYDPGSSVYRYHSAANTAPGVLSALVRFDYTNPHCHWRQWDGDAHRTTVDVLAATADVLHVHMDYRGLFQRLRVAPTDRQRVAITYHGSLPPGDPRVTYRDEATDRKLGALVFGARPYHHRHGVEHWLPIPMPVKNYRALRASVTRYPLPWEGGRLRIAHSPTKRAIKGTDDFLSVVGYLKDYGLPVEPVLIEDMSHGEALALKATCHVVFDSFWLGMQGSGLEGAAMGLPVIAGDHGAVADLEALGIPCPWTFADTREELREAVRRLCVDSGFYANEAQRVHDYTVAHHDYPVVGAKYARLLREAVRGAAH